MYIFVCAGEYLCVYVHECVYIFVKMYVCVQLCMCVYICVENRGETLVSFLWFYQTYLLFFLKWGSVCDCFITLQVDQASCQTSPRYPLFSKSKDCIKSPCGHTFFFLFLFSILNLRILGLKLSSLSSQDKLNCLLRPTQFQVFVLTVWFWFSI